VTTTERAYYEGCVQDAWEPRVRRSEQGSLQGSLQGALQSRALCMIWASSQDTKDATTG